MVHANRAPLILAAMCSGMFLVQLDVTVVNVALVSIGDDFGVGTGALALVVDAYTAVLALTLIPAGVLTDRIGTRRAVLAGLAGFGATSLLAGMAPSPAVLILARVLQGAAAGVLLPSTLAVINDAYPRAAEKARAIGLWAGVSALALPAGPLIGGAIVDAAGWRWAFGINVPVCVLACVAAARLLPTAADPDRDGAQRLKPVRRLVAGHRFRVATMVAFAMNLVGIGTIFIIAIDLQSARGLDATTAGLAMTPLLLPLAVLAPITGRLAARIGTRIPTVAGLLVGAAGSAVIAATAAAPYPVFAIGLGLLGIGMGLVTPAAVAMALEAAPPELSGTASGVNNATRQAAGAIGVALFGAIGSASPHGLAICALASAALWLAAACPVARLDRAERPTRRLPHRLGGRARSDA